MNLRFGTHLNPYERKALSFIAGTVVLSCALLIFGAMKRGYFEKTKVFYGNVKNADGISEGTKIKVAGILVGYVEDVSLGSYVEDVTLGSDVEDVSLASSAEDQENQHVRLKLRVFEKYSRFATTTASLFITRKNIIGEKEIELVPGDAKVALAENETFRHVQTFDLLSFVQSKDMLVASKDLDGIKNDVFALVKQMAQLSNETQKIFSQMKGRNVPLELLNNSNQLTKELNAVLAEMRKSNPGYVKDFSGLAKNLNALSQELQVLTPVLRETGPELPRLSRRLIEALDETVVLVKAMQKNYFLRGAVRDVKEKESEKRAPSSDEPAALVPLAPPGSPQDSRK